MPGVRQTSIESYQEIRPILGRDQEVVYAALLELKEATDSELANHLGCEDPNKVRPRRFELMRSGLVTEATRRQCRITSKTAIAWTTSPHSTSKLKPANLSPTELNNIKKKLYRANQHQLELIKQYIKVLEGEE